MGITEILPWAIGILSTLIAFKKEWIASKFTHQEKQMEAKSSIEDIEAKSLANVETSMNIYRGMVDDLKKNIEELKVEVKDLKDFIKEQKTFIEKQSKSLAYYEKKHGKIAE